MLRKTLLIILGTLLLAAVNLSFADVNPQVYYNDVEVTIKPHLGKQFINNNGVTMVPLEGFMTYFGTVFEYEQDSENIVVIKNVNRLEFIPNESYFLKNGFKILLGEPTVIKDDNMYIPLRRVMEVMGEKVVWDLEKKAIQINSGVDRVKDIRSFIKPLETLGVKGEIVEDRLDFDWPKSSDVDYFLLYLVLENGEAERTSWPIFPLDNSNYRPGYFNLEHFKDKSYLTFKVSSVIDGVESELSKDIIINLLQ